MIGIYKITSPTNRIYIWQSVDIEKRKAFYRSLQCKSQPKLYKSLLKYGFDSHKFEVITECDRIELNDLERYYQELFNTLNHGLNCMFVSSLNAPSIRSEETKKKIGAYNLGRKRLKYVCEKISIARKGMKFSTEHRLNIKKSKTGSNNKRSKIVLNTINGVFYDSIAEASEIYNIDHRTLSRYLNGTRKNKTNLISG